MISSESINFSKYSKISDINERSNDLEIIETKENSFKKEDQKELSQKLVVTNEESNDDKVTSENKYKLDKLYGNPYGEIKPKYIGNSLALFFDKYGNPRITIGPDCKYYLIINFIVRWS